MTEKISKLNKNAQFQKLFRITNHKEVWIIILCDLQCKIS